MLLKMADFTQNPLDCPPDSPRTDQNGKLLKNAHIIGHFHCITRTVGKNEDVNRANKKEPAARPTKAPLVPISCPETSKEVPFL
jgi:hypothetical protein